LKDAKLDKKLIEEVVLVGGSTRIPKVQQLLSEFFGGKELCKSVNPDEAVAYGAAVQAAILTGEKDKLLLPLVLLDVTPLSLGIETVGKVMSVVVPKNTTIPVTKSDKFTTESDNQTIITIDIYEGERASTTGNMKLGTFDLTGIPPAPRGTPSILVTFSLDANGILKVTAEDKATGKQSHVIIRNGRGRLSEEQIRDMIQEELKNKEEDDKFKKRMEAKNDLENYTFSIQSAVKDIQANGKISKDDAKVVEDAVEAVFKFLDESEPTLDQMVTKRREIESICGKVIAKAYANA